MTDNQIASLLKTTAYPDPTDTVRLRQTHVSLIFITDSFVYKIKKPVDLGFLDFTSLESRLLFCHEELRLNRRLAPHIYLDVVPVRASPSGVSIDGDGVIIDYAVKMSRLPEDLMMNRLLEQKKVSTDQIRELAQQIAHFHQASAAGPIIAQYGTPAAVRANWEENFRIVEQFIGRSISRTDFDFIRNWVEAFLIQNEVLLQRRVTNGFIREGDGDLHSANICLTDPPVIFDCIEFNERFRFIDTAADIAFLIMDLDYYCCAEFVPLFISEYCAQTGDDEVTKLIPFYEVYRAFIRGEVESIKADEAELDCNDRADAAESSRRHFRLARGLIARQRLTRTLFITCGLSGSGKSALASELSFQLGLELFSSDHIRKQLAGLQPARKCPDRYREGLYHPGHTRLTYDRLRELADRTLSYGRSVIIDATFQDQHERQRFKKLAQAHGVSFVILSLHCPESDILDRLDHRKDDSNAVSDACRSVYFQQKNGFIPPTREEGEVIDIDTGMSLMHTIDALLVTLGVLTCGLNSPGSC